MLGQPVAEVAESLGVLRKLPAMGKRLSCSTSLRDGRKIEDAQRR